MTKIQQLLESTYQLAHNEDLTEASDEQIEELLKLLNIARDKVGEERFLRFVGSKKERSF